MGRTAMSSPAWAEWALVTLLPADRAESESGDLLEAYRDEQLPARRRAGADWWYVRQVVIIFAHGYGFWLALLIALFVVSDVCNTYQVGVALAPAWPALAVILMFGASLHGGWRSAKASGGLLAGIATCSLLWLFMAAWWMTTWYPFATVQQVEPYWIDAWHYSSGPGETFVHWIFWDNVGAALMSGLAVNASGLAIGAVGGPNGSAARKVVSRM